MPICRSCEEKIPYQDLDVHQRYCETNELEQSKTNESVKRLETRISILEDRAEDRIHAVERKWDREPEWTRSLDLIGIERSNSDRNRAVEQSKVSEWE